MPWDERDNTYTLRLRKLGENRYVIDGLVRVHRPDVLGEDDYFEPVAGADFYLSGLGSRTFRAVEIIDGVRPRSETRVEDSLHRVTPGTNLGPRSAAV